ncbi:Glycoside hydrolase protein [Rutstroemia sp. NJR-2017a BBW]|nr:Glycoside hydrolase protein [Rutstroemia sp. NJR-2017a BBW]
MRRKKDSALGVKFIRKDEITNMEGALHTFVIPVVPRCEMIGDYRYSAELGGHGVVLFGDIDVESGDKKVKPKQSVRLTRTVVMSASIHMDFEGLGVMLKVCKLDSMEVLGADLGSQEGWKPLAVEEKHDETTRSEYDKMLHQHMVFHLTKDRKLPSKSSIKNPMSYAEALEFLEDVILGDENISEAVFRKYAKLHNKEVVSLELLFNVAFEQARNEFSALEALCPQGYVYTYDPASIFALAIKPPLLNRLMITAFKDLSNYNQFKNLKIFAFNNYAEPGILSLVSKALEKQKGVYVVDKAQLFKGPEWKYNISAFQQAEGAMLVIHNNSDGFGQNIETEGESGSLDGAIGSNSSAAASLERNREDLLKFVV